MADERMSKRIFQVRPGKIKNIGKQYQKGLKNEDFVRQSVADKRGVMRRMWERNPDPIWIVELSTPVSTYQILLGTSSFTP